jgi:beta-glucosidase
MNKIIFLLLALSIFISCENSGKENVAFRDLNKNQKLDFYEDPSQSIEDRIEDLLSQMTLEEKAGLMFNAISGLGMGGGMQRVDSLISQVYINHLDMPDMATAKQILEHNNTLQKIAEVLPIFLITNLLPPFKSIK